MPGVGQVWVGQVCVGQLCVGQVCVGQLCVGQLCEGICHIVQHRFVYFRMHSLVVCFPLNTERRLINNTHLADNEYKGKENMSRKFDELLTFFKIDNAHQRSRGKGQRVR